MGKNKKKVGNIFKVAGAKSLKFKAKAKAVKTDLKEINMKNKNKVAEIDKALQQLENKIRVAEVPSIEKQANPKTNLPSATNKNTTHTEKNAEEALNNFKEFHM